MSLPMHIFVETFSIAVSMLVFGVAWNAYSVERPGNLMLLACALFAAGLIDFVHMLSFKGMPDFVTPAGPGKAINFWLSARYIAALALLTVALRPWKPLSSPHTRYWLLAGSLVITAFIYWLGLFHEQAWPRTFVEGQGLTLFKIAAEYAIIAILLIPAALFYLKARQHRIPGAIALSVATSLTIQVVATIVELRDPYTAGHQRRVADLAVAIATELGLPEGQVHGLHLAGSIHDLGKIYVPAEILSKPGKLTAIEFSMIKIHPQAGYDILKDVEFSWPIAQMVLQHHERLDGSGYPQGLKADGILIEAKILVVADVVEAMATHRPYRAALGIDAALKEIERGHGTAYDAAVVDACMKLFGEKRFAFEA